MVWELSKLGDSAIKPWLKNYLYSNCWRYLFQMKGQSLWLQNCFTGARMDFGKKVWKVRNAKLDGRCTRNGKGTVVHSNAFWVILPQYPYPHPLKKFSSDLHWSQEWPWELEKVWNQTKVWRFCPLFYYKLSQYPRCLKLCIAQMMAL